MTPVYLPVPGVPGRWATTGVVLVREGLDLLPEWSKVVNKKPGQRGCWLRGFEVEAARDLLMDQGEVPHALSRYHGAFSRLLRTSNPRASGSAPTDVPWYRPLVIRDLGSDEPIAAVMTIRRPIDGCVDAWGARDPDTGATNLAREAGYDAWVVETALREWDALPAPDGLWRPAKPEIYRLPLGRSS